MIPRVAITLGDPRGIGPEIVAHVLHNPPVPADYVVIGPRPLLDEVPARRETGIVKRDTGDIPIPDSRFTLSSLDAGRIVGESVETAARMALAGEVHAIVTGPAEKQAFNLAGYSYPGHTEWLSHLAGDVPVAMMLTSERLRVVLVTTHLALREVPRALTQEKVVITGRITAAALAAGWGIARPRLAVCALNPHAGEGGLFGEEDQAVLAPAARQLGAAGPLPADTVFVRALQGEFDAVLAPYHDVGMTAIKVASFGRGVNVTLGLPFIRTAPDHGTAFDIAGQGIADASSMREAVALAVKLAQRSSQQSAVGTR